MFFFISCSNLLKLALKQIQFAQVTALAKAVLLMILLKLFIVKVFSPKVFLEINFLILLVNDNLKYARGFLSCPNFFFYQILNSIHLVTCKCFSFEKFQTNILFG